jgi:hypothetical protein
MMDADTNFNNAIDSEFTKHPGLSSDAFTYKRLVNNENKEMKSKKKSISLLAIEKKHNKTKDSADYIEFLKKELKKGANVEKEHTDDINMARKIAKDHLWEDPHYYKKLAKMETKEATGSGSSGGYVGPLFPNLESVSEACWKGYRRIGGKMKNGKMVPNCVPIKENKWTEVNFKPIFNEGKVEAKEATTTASTGSYEVPGAWAKSMSKKDWGGKKKTQIPGGKFVQIKKKCLKFPYCNQGDTGAIKLTEQNMNKREIPNTAQELIRSLPQDLKKLFFDQWGAKQSKKWHPEGNSLKHIILVIRRAYNKYGDDPNMIMAALFHDLAKMDTYAINPKTGEPTAYGHDSKSAEYVKQYADWIESFEGTNVDVIEYLVANHMKMKPSTWDVMKQPKKDPIEQNPAFDKLKGFGTIDIGGIEEAIRTPDRFDKIIENVANKTDYTSQQVKQILSNQIQKMNIKN